MDTIDDHAQAGQSRDGLSVYWARQKIASLMDQQQYGQEEAAIRQAVLDVALTHHLVSKYTSLIAVDVTPARPADKSLTSHAMKTNLPEGRTTRLSSACRRQPRAGHSRLLLGLRRPYVGWVWQHSNRIA